MNKSISVIFAVLLCITAAIGCSGSGSPMLPAADQNLTSQADHFGQANTHLWAYYDVFIDPVTQTVDAVENRHAFFTVNVTNFLNQKAASMSFKINGIVNGADYTDIDIDVAITHPFPGLPQYHGYDVRGVFMGDGSASLATGNVIYPVAGTDQMMLDDPDTSGGDLPGGGPDGYTRWYNLTEFSTGGMPMFQYTQGKLASKNFAGTATLCPYRYYADSLGKNEDAWTFLNNHSNLNGVFSSGATNERNYYLRFPNTKGIKYGYAVIADWTGVEPEYHPSNAAEAVVCSVVDQSDLFYDEDSGDFGGKINLDINLWGWSGQPSVIYLESDALLAPYAATPSQMIPTGGNENYSTWTIEVEAENITSLDNIDCWIIAEYNDDYSNNFGIGNLVQDEPLKAYFTHVLTVEKGGPPPPEKKITVIKPNGGETMQPDGEYEIKWTSENLTGNVAIEYSKDNFTSDINVISTDEPDDGSYLWTVPCDPWNTVRVRVSSINFPAVYDDSNDDFAVVGPGWASSWGKKTGNFYCGASGSDVDDYGNVYIGGKFFGETDFDPGPIDEYHNTNGGYDLFLCKYSICGEYLWTLTFGGTGWENTCSVKTDADGNVYMSGYFAATMDFDPDPVGSVIKTPVGSNDAFLVKFKTDGDFVWVRTWGGSGFDYAYDLVIDNSGSVYATGWFFGSANFNGAGGSDVKSANGGFDSFLSKYDTDGNYYWARTWGGASTDWGTGIDVDSSGSLYCSGWFTGTVDFDPGPGDASYTATGAANVGIYALKYNSSGNFIWARGWGGSNMNNWDFGADIDVNGSALAVVSKYTGTVDFNPGTGPGEVDERTSNGGEDICVSKFLTDGTYQWVRVWGNSANDAASWEVGRGVAIDSMGNIYVGAEYRNTVDFDPDPVKTYMRTSNGNLDVSLSKFDSFGTFQWARTWGAGGNDRPGTVTLDQVDCPYMVGYIQGTNANLAPSAVCGTSPDLHSSHGETDAFINKHLPDGCW